MKTKRLFSTIVLFGIIIVQFIVTGVVSQTPPDLMSYQSVIRNTAGELVTNQPVGIKLSVLQGSATGVVTYSETFTISTNENGLASLEIGAGSAVIGTFSAIDWTNGPYFLKTEIDPAGGTSYTISSVSQFLSVPYSMYAQKAGSVSGTAGGDLSGTYPDPSVVKIQSQPVSPNVPTTNDALVWNGVAWTPAANVSGAAGGDLGGTYPNPSVQRIVGFPVWGVTPNLNDALVWNGTYWSPAPNVGGAAGGDLSGTYPNPSVAKIQTRPVSAAAPLNNDALVWNGTAWTPTAAGGLGTNYWSINGTGQIFNNNTGGLVGIGTNTPTFKLDILHGGSTGARISSSSGFSTVDIDAASGDAALRFGKAGVNQWNIRNRPADDYLEIFELGGGGSRVVIQDATGNVGIGETVSPSYKLDVLHGGSTGIRSRSSGSFSVVDIDAASGDAALRFQKAGVGQWNTRNRPADDYFEIFELGGGGSRFVIQDATGNVGIGETVSPSYKLDVLHDGSTGIRSRSSASFSVVDIDAASGDAALRFQKAGVSQWNIRNRPADDYLEIFELGGGGSRFVIQDATGNVGIGETVAPSYKLDVLHGGATGIRSRSSASFSVIDIDAESGDAALRFQKAGVNQWNIRNRPADDYLEIFELGGGGSRVVIQDATGNVGIGETVAPSYKLDVLHGGATGIRSRSNTSFSVVDIDAESGDAALRFQKAGVNMWNTRNNPGTDDYQIFELGGGGERMRIENTTGKVWVNGDFTVVGVKAFTMDHPLDPENKTLMHAAAESNEVINFYSGNVLTDATGKAVVQLPDYFEAINKDFRYQLTVIGVFAQAIISKEVSNNRFEIATSQPNVKVSWEVKGVRNDVHMRQHPFAAEDVKSASQKGKYIDPVAHNQPLSKGVSYDANLSGASSLDYVAPVEKKAAAANTGGSLDQAQVPQVKVTPVDKSGSVSDVVSVSEKKSTPATSGGSLDQVIMPPSKPAPIDQSGSVSDSTPEIVK